MIKKSTSGPEDATWPAFADTMLSLSAVLLVLLLALFPRNLSKSSGTAPKEPMVPQKELDACQNKLKTCQITRLPKGLREALDRLEKLANVLEKLRQDKNLDAPVIKKTIFVILPIQEQILFDKGSCEIIETEKEMKKKQKKTSSQIDEMIWEVLSKAIDSLYSPDIKVGDDIFIELEIAGHTDDLQLKTGSIWKDQWALSSCRANVITTILTRRLSAEAEGARKQGNFMAERRYLDFRKRIHAAGYADNKPKSNDPRRNKDDDRRVEFRFMIDPYKLPDPRELSNPPEGKR